MHQIARARLDNRAADPDTTMAELEQEYRDRESELLAQISDLEDRAWSYEEHLDELSSTNTGLHEACATRRQESKLKSMRSNEHLMPLCITRQP
jgi:hypothetical protein